MYRINDTVMYGVNGVCKVINIEDKVILGNKKKYYVLKSETNDKSIFYIPVDNETLVSKMKNLMTVEEISEMIEEGVLEADDWIANESIRNERYRRIIESGNQKELFKMIREIFHEKQRKQVNKKRLKAKDVQFFKDAEQILHSELQYVLKLSGEELISYIEEKINQLAIR